MVVCQSDILFVLMVVCQSDIDGSVFRHILMVVCQSDILFVLMVVCQSDILFIDGSVSVRHTFCIDGSVSQYFLY